MHWDGYTVFSVISGVALIILGLAPGGLSAKDRIYAIIGGAFFCGYGIYVAKQTSGTFFFPVWIFIIPVVAIGYLVVAALGGTKPRPDGQTRGAAPPPPGGSGAATVAPGPAGSRPAAPSAAPMPPARPAAWSPPPPPPGSAGPRHAAPVPPEYPAAWSPPPNSAGSFSPDGGTR